MALPTDIATLYAWYKAGSLSLTNGDAVATWYDSSGNARTITSSTSPIYYTNQIAGYPAVHVGDSGAVLNLTSFGWEANLASNTCFIVYRRMSAWAVGNQYSIVGCPTGGGLEGIGGWAGADTMRKRWKGAVSFTADQTSTDLEWHYCCGFQTGTLIGISVDGGAEVTTVTSGTRDTALDAAFRIGGDSGGYCDHRVAEVIVYSSSLSTDDKGLVNAYLRDKYFSAAPSQQEQVRDTLSRRLWLLRRPTGIFEVTAPLWMLDADILDRIAVEARVGPAPAAAGWGAKKWQRRAFSVQRIDVDPGSGTLKLQLLDRRPLDVLFWDSARTDERNTSARQAGVARISKGNGFTFERQSKAWIENPADLTTIVECGQQERAVTVTGEYLEEARTNILLRSSFASGTTGLTLTGTGTNGSAIAVDTTDLFFGAETTPNSLKFTAGSPHTATLTAAWGNVGLSSTDTVFITFDHKTDSGEALSWKFQRNSDSQEWDDSTSTWIGTANNTMPTQSSRNAANRVVSKKITAGASTNFTLSVSLASGGTAGRISHLYHAQIERGNWPSSRIVTDAASVTRVKTELSHTVTTAAKIYNPTVGAYHCLVTPNWSSADLGTTQDQTIFHMTLNGGADWQTIYYDASGAQWVFEHKVGATPYYALFPGAVTRWTTYSIGARWTSSDAELGLTAYTISIFVNGVKGTDAVAAAPTFTSPETFYRGSDATFGNHANAAIAEVRVLPYAPTDQEMARLP